MEKKLVENQPHKQPQTSQRFNSRNRWALFGLIALTMSSAACNLQNTESLSVNTLNTSSPIDQDPCNLRTVNGLLRDCLNPSQVLIKTDTGEIKLALKDIKAF